jgi:tetratricopeptide (TPR) repeat protein
MIAGLSVAGHPSARAGSVVLTLEMVEGWHREDEAAKLAAAPTSGIGALERAVASFDRGEYDACLEHLGEAARADAALAPAPVLFAKLAIQKDRVSLVRPTLERAAGEHPDHPEVFLLFGDLAVREGRWTDAALHLARARDLAAAERWAGEPRRRYNLRRLQGEARVAEGRSDWKAAKAALEDWLKHEPANAKARHRLGKAFFRLDQREAAYQELQRAAREDATFEPAAISMAGLYTEAGDVKKAEEWIDYAVKAAPDSLGVRMRRATWLLDRGRAEEAQGDAAAARIDPRSRDARLLLGLAARARKDLARAEPILEALDRESLDARVRNQLALVLAEQADDAKRRRALELAEGLVRQAPDNPEVVATLGTVYYQLHRLDEAESLLQVVVASGQATSDAAYILARVESDRGHPEAGPPLLEAALAAPGLFLGRDEARRWLERLRPASRSASGLRKGS